jgi:hypothetical protein
MRKSVVRAIHVFLSFAILAGAGASLAAEIELNRINACKDISEAFSALKRPSKDCGTATGIIERTIRDYAAGSEVNLCFVERPPVASLSDFRCIRSSFRDSRAIACYRSAPAEVLTDYKTNYVTKYSAQASSYIEEAKRCPGSNGDASRIIETTFPPILMPVAEHEFGFNVQYGDTKPSSSMVSHGFARTSPTVSERGPAEIEYVVFSDGVAAELAPRTTHGNWRLYVNTSPDFAVQFIKALKRQGLDTYLASVDIGIQRAPRASVLPKEPSLPEKLSDIVASQLEDEGFEEMSDEDLKRHTGKTREKMREILLKGISFGARNFLNDQLPQIRLLMKTSGLPCTRNGRGAIGAYLFALEGQKDVQVDFGNVSAMVLGFGTCAASVNSGREYVRNLAEQAKQAVLDDLQGH